jgi:hypothetical protein
MDGPAEFLVGGHRSNDGPVTDVETEMALGEMTTPTDTSLARANASVGEL